jgi:hypothetical protein
VWFVRKENSGVTSELPAFSSERVDTDIATQKTLHRIRVKSDWCINTWSRDKSATRWNTQGGGFRVDVDYRAAVYEEGLG